MSVGYCEDCALWVDSGSNSRDGECYLHPPRLVPGAEKTYDGQTRAGYELDAQDFYRPVTFAKDMCGHFQSR